ncbi:MAG: tripartite tricarboxylate transporter TctB family protein [Pseudomonadota bacterium]
MPNGTAGPTMTLERGIAILFLVFSIAYGYTAFVTMQDQLLPFELNMSFLPNTLPKALSVAGVIVSLFVILGGRGPSDAKKPIVADGLNAWHVTQAVLLLSAMVAYALLLRPLGFIAATSLFIILTAILLGERKLIRLVAIAVFAAFVVWFLVEQLLDIVLRPWPSFIAV